MAQVQHEKCLLYLIKTIPDKLQFQTFTQKLTTIFNCDKKNCKIKLTTEKKKIFWPNIDTVGNTFALQQKYSGFLYVFAYSPYLGFLQIL